MTVYKCNENRKYAETMSGKRQPRGGRETKVRLVVDLCRQAHQRRDIEAKKRAMETLCMIYEVDPTTLTGQDIRGLSTSAPETNVDIIDAPATPPSTPTSESPPLILPDYQPPAQVKLAKPELMEVIGPSLIGLKMPVTDPDTLDLIMDDIERFITGDPQPQR